MATPVKLSDFISRLNAALASAFPAGYKVNDMGELHSRVQEFIEPLLFDNLKYSSWVINFDYSDFFIIEGVHFLTLNIDGFVDDKRRKSYNRAGKLQTPPFYECHIMAETVEEANFIVRQMILKAKLKSWTERVQSLKADLDKAHETVLDLDLQINQEYREFHETQKQNA